MLKQNERFRFSATADQIKAETMLFSASPQFAMDNGGAITRGAVDFLMNSMAAFGHNSAVVIDTRVHMLMPGMLPAIGGWHCDAIPRGQDGQTDFSRKSIIDNIRHYLLVVDAGTGSVTEFLDEDDLYQKSILDLKVPEGEINTWGFHSRSIDAFLKAGMTKAKRVESGKLYEFAAHDYHRAIPATGSGWRYFLRASVNTLTRGPLNEIRNQVQVYLPSEHLGW
jgi:hypothetical protein